MRASSVRWPTFRWLWIFAALGANGCSRRVTLELLPALAEAPSRPAVEVEAVQFFDAIEVSDVLIGRRVVHIATIEVLDGWGGAARWRPTAQDPVIRDVTRAGANAVLRIAAGRWYAVFADSAQLASAFRMDSMARALADSSVAIGRRIGASATGGGGGVGAGSGGEVKVKGYCRSDGVCVRPHTREKPTKAGTAQRPPDRR